MTIELADLELEAGLTLEPDPHAARPGKQEEAANSASEEYRLLYLPTMLGVYTARHQKMPKSNELLHHHVFGDGDHAGCEACREETEFLVAHQKKFI